MFQKGDLVRAKGETSILQEKFYVVSRSDLNTEKHNLLVDWCEIEAWTQESTLKCPIGSLN